jgi:nicotinamidase/pyrazinamidase
MKSGKALLVVDIQNDFCPGGALSIPQGDRVIPVVNKYIRLFTKAKLPVFASRDWHPKVTAHFKKYGGVWPVHCVENTRGAEFHPALKLPGYAFLLYKGMDPGKDSYSAFQAQDASGIELSNLLKILSVGQLYIAGLATDYCVKSSALDALRQGLKVTVLSDAVRGVDLNPGDSRKALEQVMQQGGKTLTFRQLEGRLK